MIDRILSTYDEYRKELKERYGDDSDAGALTLADVLYRELEELRRTIRVR